MTTNVDTPVADIPSTGFLRIRQIIGTRDEPGLIPVSRSVWWAGVADGRFPKGVKLSSRTTAWRAEDIRELIDRLAAGAMEEL